MFVFPNHLLVSGQSAVFVPTEIAAVHQRQVILMKAEPLPGKASPKHGVQNDPDGLKTVRKEVFYQEDGVPERKSRQCSKPPTAMTWGSIELSPLKSRDDPWISIGRSDGKRLDARA